MAKSTRREFIFLAAAASAGCVARGSRIPATSSPAPVVRAPAVGQSWRYAKHDYFRGKVVDTQIDRVSKISNSVEVESHSERGKDHQITFPSWGDSWWQEYMGSETGVAAAPTEVQKPWGMIVIDPHWAEPQAFEKAIPLWPSQLVPGWSTTVAT